MNPEKKDKEQWQTLLDVSKIVLYMMELGYSKNRNESENK